MKVGEESLVQILDALEYVLPSDLKAVLERTGPEGLRVRAATGNLAHEGLLGHWVDLNHRPSMARALKGHKPYLQSEDHHSEGEPDTYEGVVGLPDDHSCLVVPLRYRQQLLGALTFDSATCGAFGAEQIRAVEGFAWLAARTIYESERNENLSTQMKTLAMENASLREVASQSQLVGRSLVWEKTLESVRLVAPMDVNVLLQGETGTGKEQVARAIHQASSRKNGPFVAVNCSVLVPELALSLLFGHERGAFTGADQRRPGRFELARGGTLFLDEVAELPAIAQAQLLRVLQEKVFERVGGTESVEADVRIIAATHRDLETLVEEGQFRQDLWFRLTTFPLHLPPLREREGDISRLAMFLIQQIRTEHNWSSLSLSPAVVPALESYEWPGNVRELRNALERAAILAKGQTIRLEHLQLRGVGHVSDANEFSTSMTAPRSDEAFVVPEGYRLPQNLPRLHWATAREILRALGEAGGKQSGKNGAAALLGIPVSTLRSAIRRYELRDETWEQNHQ